MSHRIVTAAVIIIGNEILSGRTQDTNLRDIVLALGKRGIRVTEARVVPDVESVIVATLNDLRVKHDYVLTTGGIGPTHDDITAECIAKAFGVPLVEHPEIAALIRKREAPPHIMASRLRMALVPEGAGLIGNSTGGPPGFYKENVHVLAGIPAVMRAMLEALLPMLEGGDIVQSRSVTVYLGESAIAEPMRALQDEYPEVDIGSYPFNREGRFGTTLVARSTDAQRLDDVMTKLAKIIVDAGGVPEYSQPGPASAA